MRKRSSPKGLVSTTPATPEQHIEAGPVYDDVVDQTAATKGGSASDDVVDQAAATKEGSASDDVVDQAAAKEGSASDDVVDQAAAKDDRARDLAKIAKLAADSERRHFIDLALSSFRNIDQIDKQSIAELLGSLLPVKRGRKIERTDNKLVADSERKRLIDLALSSVHKDQQIAWIDRHHIIQLLRSLLPATRGRKVERPAKKAKRWFKLTVNCAAHIAGWKKRAWAKRGKIIGNRVRVNGKSVPVNEEAARRAVRHLSRGGQNVDMEPVLELLRKGRVFPNG
jgi:hypothetical protein